jgi:molybdopterin-guanine dinucleotide biosynthesis protein A
VPADAPFLPSDLVERLSAAIQRNNADVAVAASEGRRHPVVAVWAVELAGELRRAITIDKLRKVEAFVDRHRAAFVEFPAEPVDPFFNINSEADLTEAERMGWFALGPEAPGESQSTAASARLRSTPR